jgi:hypothetical protein
MRWVLAAVIVGAAGVSHAETPSTPIPDNLDPCWAFTEDATYVNHTIHKQLENRDIHMRVPIEYFVSGGAASPGFSLTG